MDRAFFIGDDTIIQLDGVVGFKKTEDGVIVYTISGSEIKLTGKDADDMIEDYKSRAAKINAVAKYQYENSETKKIVELYSEESKIIKPAAFRI